METSGAPEEKVFSAALRPPPPDIRDASRSGVAPDAADRLAIDNTDHDVEKPPLRTAVEEAEDQVITQATADKLETDLSRSETATSSSSVATSNAADLAQSPPSPQKRSFWTTINPLKAKVPPPIPKERHISPEYNAGIFSRATFHWMAPVMHVGYQRTLELGDIWLINPERSVDVLADRLEKNFRSRVERKSKKPLRGALYDTFKKEFLIGGACQLVSAVAGVMNPFILRYLIQFVQKAYIAKFLGGAAPPIGHGVGLIVGITLINTVQSLTTHTFLYNGQTVGAQSRTALIAMIFDKAMTVSNRAKSGHAPVMKDMPADIKPGSPQEKSWFKQHLPQRKPKNKPVEKDDKSWDNGRITNLMSTDTARIELASGFFHMGWTAPIVFIVVLALLLINITYSALAGYALLFLTVPLLGRAVKSLIARRKAINKITDQRVSLTNEILHSVKFVKFFAAEMNFLERLNAIRKREIAKTQFMLNIRNAIMAVGMSMPLFASMVSFVVYSVTNHGLAPANIFSSLALFNALRFPLLLLPMVIGQVVDALASMARIEEFLLLEDNTDAAEWDTDRQDAVIVHDAEFTWEKAPIRATVQEKTKRKSQEKPTMPVLDEHKSANRLRLGFRSKKTATATSVDEKLNSGSVSDSPSQDRTSSSSTNDHDNAALAPEPEDIPFNVRIDDLVIGRNELVAVIGKVGCGKSSLLSALAGDMRRTDGSVVLGASRAYVPQTPWIRNATLKDNVVFGREYNKRWYNQVIEACALRADIDMLPAGDLTEIGEKGITVSGGQKQRLNLARAVYFDADLVLLDDPLSAVDAHVGKHIMDNAICGLLADKCRILVTHQLHVLHRCDRIVWMDQGRIKAVDTFPNLMASSEEFRQLLSSTADETTKTTEDDDEQKKEDLPSKDVKKARNKKAVALMQEEERATKSVAWSVYANYLRACGAMFAGPLILLLLVTSQGAVIASSLWLSFWTSNKFGYSTGTYIGVYAALGVGQAILNFFFSVAVVTTGTRASKKMLSDAVFRVLRAPMSFFDTTPLGRVMNRFTKDTDTMDNVLTDSFRMFLTTSASIIAVLILIVAYFYYFLVALVPLVIFFILAANFYRASAREMKRHEAVLRSNVYSRFNEAIYGVPTIRAYGLEKHFSSSVREAVDIWNGPNFLTFSNQRWLGVRLDVIGSLLIFTTGILVVTSRFTINPSTSGLVLSYILSIVQFLQFSVRQLAEVENNMSSTERLNHYATELEEEAPLHTIEVEPSWPAVGAIEFKDVEMRYRAGLPLVLKGLSMSIRGGERVGFVGRTGAGKSSIMATLFRLTELSGGSISIDGLDIAKVGLADLRSRLGIIPQDPTLFKGTIRYNLDPFEKHTDLELWTALRQADLIGPDQTMSDRGTSIRIHLDFPVEDEGLNLSTGQRQLLALARALVAGTRVLIMDEMSSSVDQETDSMIQQTILSACVGKTLLTIAHRLRTTVGYDRICVMDQGRIVELDTPQALFLNKTSQFRSMCLASGIGLETIEAAQAERLDIERVRSKALEG